MKTNNSLSPKKTIEKFRSKKELDVSAKLKDIFPKEYGFEVKHEQTKLFGKKYSLLVDFTIFHWDRVLFHIEYVSEFSLLEEYLKLIDISASNFNFFVIFDDQDIDKILHSFIKTGLVNLVFRQHNEKFLRKKDNTKLFKELNEYFFDRNHMWNSRNRIIERTDNFYKEFKELSLSINNSINEPSHQALLARNDPYFFKQYTI